MFARKTLLQAAAIAALAVAPAIASGQSGGGNNPNTGQVTVGNLIAALNNISANIGELNALNDLTVSRVRLVDVDNVLNNNNVQALNNALNRNNTEILNLRNVLNNNEIVKNVLNGADINISRVVAIDVLSGGDLIVFYQ